MSTVKDYIGRSFDVLLIQNVRDDVAATVTPVGIDLVDKQGISYITTGVQKLVQRFMLTLLTATGSMAYQPLRGTRFMVDAATGMWRTRNDVFQSFNSAAIDVKRQMRSAEKMTDPDDEKYAAAKLLGVVFNGDTVSVTVRVDSVAGDAYVFVAPIPVTVR